MPDGSGSNFPEDLLYTKDHEWVRVTGSTATIGITYHAQKQLGDIVYVERPNVGESFQATEPFGTVESVKAVSEVYMPIDGKVSAVNTAVSDEPESVNDDPYGAGWLIQISVDTPSQLDGLLSSSEYANFVSEDTD